MSAQIEGNEKFVPSFSGYEVVAVYAHDPSFFTQGLAFADGMLYEGTGQYGHSLLCRRFIDGTIETIRLLPPHFFGEGVTVFQDQIIQLTWKSGRGFVWDKKNMQLRRFFSYFTEGWGITNDGKSLIMSDGSSILTYLSPETFAVEKKLRVTDGDRDIVRLNELEYVMDEIWANIWKEKRIARIHPESGRVIGWIDLTKLAESAAPPGGDSVLNGIAYDSQGGRVFVTGKYWDKMFEIRITSP
ncbi:MAG: glutaminyl-peptide cyclotransferase [Pseudomonadota bacterium]